MSGWSSLIAALSLAASAAVTIDVPYLPQSEALCGGAAVAMVFRYWGDAHADVQQFVPLVDVRAGGIATDKLAAAVAARGWRATPLAGSVDLLHEQLEARRPIIILLEDRPGHYHYVVVTGADNGYVTIHDPAVGPSRRLADADLVRKWKATDFWALLILPGSDRRLAAADSIPPPSTKPPGSSESVQCDRLLADAVAKVHERGLESADAIFGSLRAECPSSAGPLRELAGVRFAEHRWAEATSLAEQALALDRHDAYGWEVLASSRFMQDDFSGSLDAWNQIGKPQIDSVQIHGANRTRYELMTRALGLTANTLLTDEAFERAARRLAELPDETSTRMSYRPGEDGFATVDVAVAERSLRPKGIGQWAATAARFLIDREVDVAVPGPTGQGEVWEASWRWWSNRPRVALAFAAPRVGRIPGVWRVEGSWEAQKYALGTQSDQNGLLRETRAHGGVSVSDWLTGNVRYELRAGVDAWDVNRRTVSLGGGLQRRLAHDRVALFGDVDAWMPMDGDAFRSVSARALFNSSKGVARWLFTADAGVDGVTTSAPLALWPGAGDGHARPALLRAHPLLSDGVVTGPAFGRTLTYGNTELQRWLERGTLVRFGVAAFADAARATRAFGNEDPRAQLDVGVGLRLRVPGAHGVVRADVAAGVRDGAHAITVGWQR
ncbi:MAG TPA: papain-like cysteine protease family protein [Vicinamibacterales bacterium]